MRSSPSKVVRFFPIKIKQNWQQAVPKPDATREKGKWLQTKLPTQKSLYPKQPPITKRTGNLSHTGDYLTADPKRKRSLRTSPPPIDCKPYSVTRLATLFEPMRLEPKAWAKMATEEVEEHGYTKKPKTLTAVISTSRRAGRAPRESSISSTLADEEAA